MPGAVVLEGIVLYSENLERAKAFYADVLELPLLLEEAHALHFDAGGARLAIHRYPTEGSVETPEGFLMFAVDDLDATYEDLRRRGAEFLGPPATRSYGRVAYLHDPEGHEIGLIEEPPAGTEAYRRVAPLVDRLDRVRRALRP